jgi:uncharacterized protein (TIGR02271 family)
MGHNQGKSRMEYETIIAAYETVEEADAVVRDLKDAGVAAEGIGRHVKGAASASNRSESLEAFWTGLLGIETEERDARVYDRTLASGGAVVTARVPVKDSESALAVLEAHHPIDLEERSGGDDEAEVVALAEETLEVGKRAVPGETTRIRRYTVEAPVEEQVSLRRESVSVERRPVTGASEVSEDAFTDKTVEVTETNEEAVVAKTARIAEEVVIHKDVEQQVETVRDTVRRDKVEIESVPVTKKTADVRR